MNENFYREKYLEAHKKNLVAIRTLAAISEAKYTRIANEENLTILSDKAQEALDELMKPSEVKT